MPSLENWDSVHVYVQVVMVNCVMHSTFMYISDHIHVILKHTYVYIHIHVSFLFTGFSTRHVEEEDCTLGTMATRSGLYEYTTYSCMAMSA